MHNVRPGEAGCNKTAGLSGKILPPAPERATGRGERDGGRESAPGQHPGDPAEGSLRVDAAQPRGLAVGEALRALGLPLLERLDGLLGGVSIYPGRHQGGHHRPPPSDPPGPRVLRHGGGEPLVVDEAHRGQILQRRRDLLRLESRPEQPALQLPAAAIPHAEQAKRPVLRRATRADRAFAV